MKTLVKKMSSFGILKMQLVIGALVMIAVVIALPLSIILQDASLILNPFVLGVVLIGMLIFGLFAYFLFIRPYFIYRSSPDVLAETDSDYLYVHGNKEAKIPLSALEGAVITYQLPFIYSKELIATLITYFFSDKYGDIILDVPGYGSFKLRFVSDVMKTSKEFNHFISLALSNIEIG